MPLSRIIALIREKIRRARKSENSPNFGLPAVEKDDGKRIVIGIIPMDVDSGLHVAKLSPYIAVSAG